jgi:hypothetical protein
MWMNVCLVEHQNTSGSETWGVDVDAKKTSLCIVHCGGKEDDSDGMQQHHLEVMMNSEPKSVFLVCGPGQVRSAVCTAYSTRRDDRPK